MTHARSILFLLLASVGYCAEPIAPLTIIPNGIFHSGASYEVLTWEGLKGNGHRRDNWHPDPTLSKEWRTKSDDYDGAFAKFGLARFHHAPCRDFTYQEHIDQTFSMSNCSPGNADLNSGFWSTEIEATVEAMRRPDNKLWVFTAPVYQPDDEGRFSLQTIGEHHIPVPTAYTKCVLEKQADRPYRMIAWLVPNCPPPAGAVKEDYQVWVDDVEEKIAFDVFDWLDEATQKKLEGPR